MKRFIIYVEFENGTGNDYARLYSLLAPERVINRFMDSKGEMFYYPAGMAQVDTDKTRDKLLEVVIEVAKKFGKKFKVVIIKTESKGVAIGGNIQAV
jgi:hypothetical protein